MMRFFSLITGLLFFFGKEVGSFGTSGFKDFSRTNDRSVERAKSVQATLGSVVRFAKENITAKDVNNISSLDALIWNMNPFDIINH